MKVDFLKNLVFRQENHTFWGSEDPKIEKKSIQKRSETIQNRFFPLKVMVSDSSHKEPSKVMVSDSSHKEPSSLESPAKIMISALAKIARITYPCWKTRNDHHLQLIKPSSGSQKVSLTNLRQRWRFSLLYSFVGQRWQALLILRRQIPPTSQC